MCGMRHTVGLKQSRRLNSFVDPSGAEAGLIRGNYRKLSNTRRTKSQNLNVSPLGLQLSLLDILKPNV